MNELRLTTHQGSKPMMKCGHSANATCSSYGGQTFDPPIPACAICDGPDCITLAELVDLTGRIARCSYHGSCRNRNVRNGYGGVANKPDYGTFSDDGHSVAPSSTDLPFFEHKPNEPFDEYYCGCIGWD